MKNGVRLTIEMRLTLKILVELAVRHAIAYAVHAKSPVQAYPYVVYSTVDADEHVAKERVAEEWPGWNFQIF